MVSNSRAHPPLSSSFIMISGSLLLLYALYLLILQLNHTENGLVTILSYSSFRPLLFGLAGVSLLSYLSPSQFWNFFFPLGLFSISLWGFFISFQAADPNISYETEQSLPLTFWEINICLAMLIASSGLLLSYLIHSASWSAFIGAFTGSLLMILGCVNLFSEILTIFLQLSAGPASFVLERSILSNSAIMIFGGGILAIAWTYDSSRILWLPLLAGATITGGILILWGNYLAGQIQHIDSLQRSQLLFSFFLVSVLIGLLGGISLYLILDTLQRRKERNAMLSNLQESQLQNHLILESIKEGVLGLDNNHRITFTNHAAAKILNYTMDELVGLPFSIIFHENVHGDLVESITELLPEIKDNESAFQIGQFRRKEGSLIPVTYSMTPIWQDQLQNQDVVVFRDISQFQHATDRMREANKQLREIMENAHSFIFVKDIFGHYTKANSFFLELVGKPEHDVIGKSDNELFNPQLCQVLKTLEKEVITFEETKEEEVDFRLNGATRTFKLVLFPLHNTRGGISAVCGIGTDLTEKKQHQEQLQDYIEMFKLVNSELIETRREAEQANVAKSAFLANMSHEIRTPLNGVIGMTSLLYNTRLTETQEKYVNRINLSGKMLLDLINDIIDISKIEEGKLKLEQIPCKINELLKEVGDMVAIKAFEKGLDFIIDFVPEGETAILTDPTRFRQILLNLMSNAIKFTSSGYVRIKSECHKLPSGKLSFKCEICDTGVGIAKEKQEQIFLKFTQADSSTTRKFGGTGLGLAICRQLVSLMGGKIGCRSEEGHGSTFWIDIPIPMVQPENELQTTWDHYPSLTGKTALIVDKSDLSRIKLERILKPQEISCHSTSSNEECLSAIRRQSEIHTPYDIVLAADEREGFTTLEMGDLISTDTQLTTPLILLSMINMYGSDEEKEHGIIQSISKPIYPPELLKLLNQQLKQRSTLLPKN